MSDRCPECALETCVCTDDSVTMVYPYPTLERNPTNTIWLGNSGQALNTQGVNISCAIVEGYTLNATDPTAGFGDE